MNKKGQALSLNTVIMAIIVVVVLIVVVSFFLFGFQGLTQRARALFFGTTAGTDTVLAVQNCEQFCDQAVLLPSEALIKSSPYCSFKFRIDKNNDGEADKDKEGNFIDFYCNDFGKAEQKNNNHLGVICGEKFRDKTINQICKD